MGITIHQVLSVTVISKQSYVGQPVMTLTQGNPGDSQNLCWSCQFGSSSVLVTIRFQGAARRFQEVARRFQEAARRFQGTTATGASVLCRMLHHPA
ncbi:Endoplasmic reticulum resident protein 27 [Clarias magur]|uniref:Endoplasmic reticulum resident protein 27 n=1 Tax=Clarias magur TaxID=1594786 RepID=A0A8J4WV88_CLAMG|nr:Endoplasmic reticulum resident protein 27 [Clarias magur]